MRERERERERGRQVDRQTDRPTNADRDRKTGLKKGGGGYRRKSCNEYGQMDELKGRIGSMSLKERVSLNV